MYDRSRFGRDSFDVSPGGSKAGAEAEILEFRLLGPLEVSTGGRVLPLGGETQRRVLAVLLWRAPEVTPTDAIVEAVWASDPPTTATGLVRTYVSRLRKILSAAEDGDALLLTRSPGYVLDVAPEQVDATRFEQLVGQARQEAAGGRLSGALATLDEALGLWRGNVLADIAVSESLRPLISRLEQIRLSALEDRVEARLALGHHAEVVPELRALTAEVPFRERLWSHLIVALYRTGRQAEALSAYQNVRSILAEELGIEPGPDLQALERGILQHAPDLTGVQPVFVQYSGLPRTPATKASIPLPPALIGEAHAHPLVGRDAERARLSSSLGKARAGKFGAVFVSGSPGIGKTALVAAFAQSAHAEGVTVLHGRADEDAPLPFQSVREALGHWVASVTTEPIGLLDEEGAARLARIVPSLRTRFNGASSAPNVDGEAERYLLLEAVARWLAVLAADRPVVLVLDDLHWADQATLLVVRHLLRHPPAAGVLLVATYRDTEPGSEGALPGVLASTRGDRRIAHIELGGLADSEVTDLLRTQAGRDINDSGRTFAAGINQRAGGNPLFIHETLRHLIERGDIAPTANRWGDGELIGSSGVPEGVQQVLEQRLRRLPEPSTKLLRQAAVLGEQFDLSVLSEILGASQLAVVEVFEPAVAAGFVGPRGPHADRFAFSHALVREAILEGLQLSDRARAHWDAGRALAATHVSHPEPRLGEIAHHLAMGVSAGNRQMAISANVDAGTQALEALAFEDALTRFRTAAELLETTALVDPQLAYTVWSGLAHAAIASGVWGDDVREGHLRSAAIAREQQWGRSLAQVAIGFSAFSSRAGTRADDDAARGLIDEALVALDGSRVAERVLLLAIKAVGALFSSRSDESRELAMLAGEVASSSNDPVAQAGALLARCCTLMGGPEPAELGRLAEQMLARRGPLVARIYVYGSALCILAVSCLQRGDRAGFEGVRTRGAALPETRHSSYLADVLRLWDAGLALAGGRFDEVENRAAGVSLTSNRSAWHGVVTSQDALARIEQGGHADIRTSLRRSLESATEIVLVRAALALLDAEAGDTAAAAQQVQALRQHSQDSRAGRFGQDTMFVYRCLSEVAARLHDPRLAADLLPRVNEYSSQLLVSYTGMMIHGAADRAIGQLLHVLGRHDEAINHLEAALEMEQSFGAEALRARTAFWQARARVTRGAAGDQETARRLLQQASVDARRLGMSKLERDAASLLITV